MYGNLPYTLFKRKFKMNIQRLTMSNQQPRQERLEARVSPELKKRLQYAADLLGCSLSEFLLRNAEAAANEVIREHQIIRLTTEDSRAFVNALLNPPEPNSQLRSAFENYKKDVSSDL